MKARNAGERFAPAGSPLPSTGPPALGPQRDAGGVSTPLSPRRPAGPALVLLYLSLVVPSLGLVHRVGGGVGLVVYAAGVGIALVAVARVAQWERLRRWVEPRSTLVALATLLVLGALFLVVYPIVNAGGAGGGSDRDEALALGASALIRGEYPYSARTYLGNPISPLPGALLLAVPFVLAGNGALGNLFWLAVLVAVARARFASGAGALGLMWTVLALSPAVLYMVVTGSDYVANGIYVALAVVWVARSASAGGWREAAAAVFLGVALASRANFLIVVPLVFAFVASGAGVRVAVWSMAVTGATFAALTVPFYLADPAGFSPLHIASVLPQFRSVLPFADVVVPAANLALAVGLAVALVSRGSADPDRLLRDCAVVLAFPVACGVALSSLAWGALDLRFADFGTLFLFAGVLGGWSSVLQPGEAPRKSTA